MTKCCGVRGINEEKSFFPGWKQKLCFITTASFLRSRQTDLNIYSSVYIRIYINISMFFLFHQQVNISVVTLLLSHLEGTNTPPLFPPPPLSCSAGFGVVASHGSASPSFTARQRERGTPGFIIIPFSHSEETRRTEEQKNVSCETFVVLW